MKPHIPQMAPQNRGKPTIIPVWFDAWRYEREKDLITPILGAIFDAAQEHDEHPLVRSVGDTAAFEQIDGPGVAKMRVEAVEPLERGRAPVRQLQARQRKLDRLETKRCVPQR